MNTRVLLHLLDIVAVMFKICPSALSKQAANVVEILLNLSRAEAVAGSKVAMRAQILDLFRHLMQLCTPNYTLIDLVLPHLEQDNKKATKLKEVRSLGIYLRQREQHDNDIHVLGGTSRDDVWSAHVP